MKQYIIPYNFAREGYVYGKITWSSMVQAIILVGAAGSVIFRLLPFPFKVRMYLAIFILLPLAVLALKGIHELSLPIDWYEDKVDGYQYQTADA